MVKKLLSMLGAGVAAVRDFLAERGLGAGREVSRLHHFAHFWLLVARSFSRNRCPVRAAALAYTSLLAMIPMLAVALSVSSSLLEKDGTEQISRMIDRLVASITPPAVTGTNAPDGSPAIAPSPEAGLEPAGTHAAPVAAISLDARRQVSSTINGFIQNTRSSTLGVTGMALLVLAAIAMLSRIEETFNDIWGVARGRKWFARLWQYWGVITLGPMFLTVALGLMSRPYFTGTARLVTEMPFVGGLVFKLLPLVLLVVAFTLFYLLMPNTRVRWQAALAGGLVGGVLWHVNNLFGVLYVSRVVTNSKIYGSLGMVPVVMLGLYFSWLILLFGAQVAYAYQNRAAYLQQKLCDNLNQRAREFVALRLMTCVGQRFQQGLRPATITEIAATLAVPTRLIQQIVQVLVTAQLVVEVTGGETACAPGRPLENVTCHDVLLALRAGQGQELPTSDEAARTEVHGEFERILEAERLAASSVTVLDMVQRAETRALAAMREVKAVTDSPGSTTPS